MMNGTFSELFRKDYPCNFEATKHEEPKMSTPKQPIFCLIDSEMNDRRMLFEMSGARMDRFLKNPVMLYMHRRGEVIGRWADVQLVGDKLEGTPVFDMEDPEAAKVAGKVERGFLKAASLGIHIHAAEYVAEGSTDIRVTDWEPFEGSIVDAGSNANAVALYTADAEPIADIDAYIGELKLSIMSNQATTVTPAAPAFPKEIALAAGLDENADASAVEVAVKKLASENAALKLAAENTQKARVKDLLDNAEKDKKIKATERQHYETLAAANFEAVQAVIAGLAAPQNLKRLAEEGGGQSQEVSLAAEWDSLDKAGTLAKLKQTDPARFEALKAARFPKT